MPFLLLSCKFAKHVMQVISMLLYMAVFYNNGPDVLLTIIKECVIMVKGQAFVLTIHGYISILLNS
jgi:hypothetical protein